MRHVRMPSGRRLAGIVVSLILSIGICTAAAGISPANAAPGNGNGATVVRNPYGSPVDCQIYDTVGDYWIFTCKIQQVIQPNGTVREYLKGSIDPAYSFINSPNPSSARTDITTTQTGLFCDFVNGNYTNIVAGAVTPSGQVNLTCSS